MRRCEPRTLLVALLLLVSSAAISQAACPSNCNRHGVCGSSNTCTCFPGYTGFDCNDRACPVGAPWVDFATADNSARSVPRECSNRGQCNRGNGRCECDAGFAGVACERLQLCRTNCNGHGKSTYTAPWDADRIYGCVCDRGYTGVDCSERQCPYGDDPISTGQVDEIQAVSCLCGAGCSGTFTLSFRGETTRPLDGGVDTAATLATALEGLLTIRGISVTLDGGTTLCSANGVSALVTFTYEHGDVPALVVTSKLTGTNSLTVQTDGAAAAYASNLPTQRGTKEWLECSGRGMCNTLLGLCSCQPGFGPSDALGNSGGFLDCGYYSGTSMTCPGIAGSVTRCYGQGICSGAPLYRCNCNGGFKGYDCSQPVCPTGRAWAEEVQINNVAHYSVVQCSNAGLCTNAGVCKCLPGFEGAACARMSCPTTGNGAVCSGRGVCKSLRELAALTPTVTYGAAGFVYGSDPNAMTTWESDMVYGCYCDKVTLDKGTIVRYSGYNCAKIPCPSGDDPWTTGQVDEVQTVACTASGGSFTFSFRGETTLPLPYSASTAQVEAALESLTTITSVSVTFSAGSACTSSGNTMAVTFFSPSGDLPLLSVSSSALTSSSAVSVAVTQTTQGTKEDSVCNNRGRCDEDSGACICALYHASSDAQGSYGVLDDCGAVDAFMTHGEL